MCQTPLDLWPSKEFGWNAMNRTIQLFDGKYKNDFEVQHFVDELKREIGRTERIDIVTKKRVTDPYEYLMVGDGWCIHDWLYVPTSNISFVGIFAQLAHEGELFVELFASKLLHILPSEGSHKDIDPLRVLWLWGGDRAIWERNYTDSLLGMHPIKLSTFQSLGEDGQRQRVLMPERAKFCDVVLDAFYHNVFRIFEVIFDGVGINFAASFLHDEPAADYITHFVISPCYMALLECGAFNFLYKYAATCSKKLYDLFHNKYFIGGLSTLATIWVLLHVLTTVYFTPSQALREKVALALNDKFGTDFRNPNVYFGGIDKDASGKQAQGIGTVIATVNFMNDAVVRLENTADDRVEQNQRTSEESASKSIEIAGASDIQPTLFRCVPTVHSSDIDSSEKAFSWFNAYALLFFPLLNPVIVVLCIKEFRNTMLTRLNCWTRKAEPAHTLSLSRRSTP
ncbi:hypothetical protein PRIPAC_92602 [Pristionchus pacificus]|nr:hypothetical protein PRIPAC_92602 [Pristionchus pacificus]